MAFTGGRGESYGERVLLAIDFAGYPGDLVTAVEASEDTSDGFREDEGVMVAEGNVKVGAASSFGEVAENHGDLTKARVGLICHTVVDEKNHGGNGYQMLRQSVDLPGVSRAVIAIEEDEDWHGVRIEARGCLDGVADHLEQAIFAGKRIVGRVHRSGEDGCDRGPEPGDVAVRLKIERGDAVVAPMGDAVGFAGTEASESGGKIGGKSAKKAGAVVKHARHDALDNDPEDDGAGAGLAGPEETSDGSWLSLV